MAVTFPAGYDTAPCYIVAINEMLVPYVAGMLQIMEKRGFWASDSDYEQGYNAVVALEGCMMATCLTDLIASQDRMYRMMNTAIFGQLYDVTIGPPLVVTPEIAPAVTLDVLDRDSIMGRLDRIAQLVDNAINGTETPLYTYSPSVKALLQSIIDAIGADETDLSSILSELETIALLVA